MGIITLLSSWSKRFARKRCSRRTKTNDPPFAACSRQREKRRREHNNNNGFNVVFVVVVMVVDVMMMRKKKWSTNRVLQTFLVPVRAPRAVVFGRTRRASKDESRRR